MLLQLYKKLWIWIFIFPPKQFSYQKYTADWEANVVSLNLKKKEDVFLSLAFGFNVPEKMYFQCIKIWPAISRFFSNLIEHKNTWLLSISFLSIWQSIESPHKIWIPDGHSNYNDIFYLNFDLCYNILIQKPQFHLVHVCKIQVSVPNLEFKYWRVSTRFGTYWYISSFEKVIYLQVFEK